MPLVERSENKEAINANVCLWRGQHDGSRLDRQVVTQLALYCTQLGLRLRRNRMLVVRLHPLIKTIKLLRRIPTHIPLPLLSLFKAKRKPVIPITLRSLAFSKKSRSLYPEPSLQPETSLPREMEPIRCQIVGLLVPVFVPRAARSELVEASVLLFVNLDRKSVAIELEETKKQGGGVQKAD